MYIMNFGCDFVSFFFAILMMLMDTYDSMDLCCYMIPLIQRGSSYRLYLIDHRIYLSSSYIQKR
jgi:hypothetical protein